jgi:hypothetical protein
MFVAGCQGATPQKRVRPIIVVLGPQAEMMPSTAYGGQLSGPKGLQCFPKPESRHLSRR